MADEHSEGFDFSKMIDDLAKNAGLDKDFKMPDLGRFGDILGNNPMMRPNPLEDVKIEVIGSRVIIDCNDDASAAELGRALEVISALQEKIMELFKGFM